MRNLAVWLVMLLWVILPMLIPLLVAMCGTAITTVQYLHRGTTAGRVLTVLCGVAVILVLIYPAAILNQRLLMLTFSIGDEQIEHRPLQNDVQGDDSKYAIAMDLLTNPDACFQLPANLPAPGKSATNKDGLVWVGMAASRTPETTNGVLR